MSVYFIKTNELAAELAANKVDEKTKFYYFLADSLLWVFAVYYSVLIGSYTGWTFYLEFIIMLLITIVGLMKTFEANGGKDGSEYIVRATCLTFPILFKVTLVSVLLGWLLFYISPYIINQQNFRDPDFVFDVIYFLWAPTFIVIYYWRLTLHLKTVASSKIERKALSEDR